LRRADYRTITGGRIRRRPEPETRGIQRDLIRMLVSRVQDRHDPPVSGDNVHDTSDRNENRAAIPVTSLIIA
jgi:hypothetical protein